VSDIDSGLPVAGIPYTLRVLHLGVQCYMFYDDRVLAFIDILGFRKKVGDTMKDESGAKCENSTEIQNIMTVLREMWFTAKHLDTIAGRKVDGKRVTQFSDSVVFSYPARENIYHILQDVYFSCIATLKEGFLLRGAVVLGKVLHNEEMLFGPAFLDAYDLERNSSKNPRVIIDRKIIALAETRNESVGLGGLTSYDCDGKLYINYVDKLDTGVDIGRKYELEHLGLIINTLNILKKDLDEYDTSTDKRLKNFLSLKEKYLWLKSKFINSLSKFMKCHGSCCPVTSDYCTLVQNWLSSSDKKDVYPCTRPSVISCAQPDNGALS